MLKIDGEKVQIPIHYYYDYHYSFVTITSKYLHWQQIMQLAGSWKIKLADVTK